MGLCSSSSTSAVADHERDRERATAGGEADDSLEKPRPAKIDAKVRPEDQIEEGSIAKGESETRQAEPTLANGNVKREKDEEEAAAMLMKMKERAEEERKRQKILDEMAKRRKELERPLKEYLTKKRLGLFNIEASKRLLEEAMHGHESEVLQAIDDGADVNYRDKDYGWTALILACTHGHAGCVRALLGLKGCIADENAKDNYGCTALISAVKNSHTEIVQVLIQARSGRIDLEAKDNKARTALLVAQARSCFEEQAYPSTVSILRSAGAKS